jgi:CRISPR-associated endonuclease/helicase Cas3
MNPYRHEWISLRLFEAFVHSCGDTDKWISQLTSISGKRHDFSWFENVIKDEIDQVSNIYLPQFAQLVAWLIVTSSFTYLSFKIAQNIQS